MIPASWTEPLRRGYSIEWCATVEGIRYVWSERPLLSTDGTAPAEPSGYVSTIPALVIGAGQTVGCAVDRQTGVATGRAYDLRLSASALEGAGLLAALFRRPSIRARLTADETTGAATTLHVDSTAGWSTSGTAYVGLETVTYGGTTGTSFTSVTRGVVGRVHPHRATTPHALRYVTDAPTIWRGRLVSLWAHLVAPDGYLLADTLCTAGDYCVEVWCGTVDAQPEMGAHGVTLRALPLVRALSRDIGAALTGHVALAATAVGWQHNAWIVTSPGDTVQVTVEDEASGVLASISAPAAGSVRTVDTLLAWGQEIALEIETALGGTWRVDVGTGGAGIWLHLSDVASHGGWIQVTVQSSGLYWLPDGLVSRSSSSTYDVTIPLPIAYGEQASGIGWLPVSLDASEDWQAVDLGGTGTLAVTVGNATEIVRWSGTLTTGLTPGVTWLLVTERAPLGQRVQIWTDGAEASIVSGSRGPLAKVLGELVESSGLTVATRGTYDTLGMGYGLSLPGERVDYASLASYPWGALEVDGAADEARSVEKRLGGWLALSSECLVQRTVDGVVQISAVSTVPVSSAPTSELSDSDALLDGHAAGELVEAPTTVRVKSSDQITVLVRDVSRAEAEGERVWDVEARGVDAVTAHVHGLGLISIADGQTILDVELGAWAPVRVGDVVTLTTAHPLAYDWATGSRGVSSVVALVAAHEIDLYTLVHRVSLLLPGGAAVGALCPSLVVESVDSSTQVTVASGGSWLTDGDDVTTYTPGDDGTATQQTVDTVVGDVITFTVAHGLSVGDVITYPLLSSATTAQERWAYRDDGTVLR